MVAGGTIAVGRCTVAVLRVLSPEQVQLFATDVMRAALWVLQ